MKRKLIGILKVYKSVADGMETYETVWPRNLYDLVNTPSSRDDRRKARTVSTWAKRSAPCVMAKWGRR